MPEPVFRKLLAESFFPEARKTYSPFLSLPGAARQSRQSGTVRAADAALDHRVTAR